MLSSDNMVKRKRNSFLTLFLVLSLIAQVSTTVSYQQLIFNEHPIFVYAPLRISVLFMIGVLDVLCNILILNWNKFGFYGALSFSLIFFCINISFEEISYLQSSYGIIGVLILYLLMQIKKNGVSAWGHIYN